MNVLRF